MRSIVLIRDLSASQRAEVEPTSIHLDRIVNSLARQFGWRQPVLRADLAAAGLRSLFSAHGIPTRRSSTYLSTVSLHCATADDRPATGLPSRLSAGVRAGCDLPWNHRSRLHLPRDHRPADRLWRTHIRDRPPHDSAACHDGSPDGLFSATSLHPRCGRASDGSLCIQLESLSVRHRSAICSANRRITVRTIGLQSGRSLNALPNQSTRPECRSQPNVWSPSWSSRLVAKFRSRLARARLVSLAHRNDAGPLSALPLSAKLDHGRR